MTTETNEIGEDYANGGYAALPPDGQTVELPMTMPGDTVDSSIAIGNPITKDLDPSSITVYANSINPVSSMGDSAIVAFDVVFSVSCVCPDSGRTSTYQVVKRIGVDKMKMANDAKMSTPISIVEAKKQSTLGLGVSTARFKALAGLS